MKNLLILLFFILSFGCQKKGSDSPASSSSPKFLYFSAGACYVGSLTGSIAASTTASGIVNRVSLDSGQIQGVPLFDYNQAGLNIWPVGIANFDNDYLLANIRSSTAGFRVDKIKKSSLQDKSDYFTDITNLASALRSINLLSDGSVLISRSSMIEKYTSSLTRVTNTLGTASYISNPAGGCTSSNTLISGLIPLDNSDVFYIHAGGATNNRVGVIDKDGYDVAADCKSAITFSGASSPATTAVPTAAVIIPGTDPYQIIVSTASSTAGSEQLWLFTVDSSTSAITFVKSLYSDLAHIRGVSALTYDSTTKFLYAANGSTSLGNTVEKFSYDSITQTLTRVNTFLGLNFDSQCINSMFVGN